MSNTQIGFLLLFSPFIVYCIIYYLACWIDAIEEYKNFKNTNGIWVMIISSSVFLLFMLGIYLMITDLPLKK